MREAYQKYVAEYFHELEIRCGQAKIDFVTADVNQGFDQVLKSYLIKRASMK